MKKVYIVPSVDIQKYNVTNLILTGSITSDDIDYGGIDEGDHEPDVKGESWTDIWE